MMHGLYIGATGLKTHGEGMQIVSHNIANVSTVGYKQQQWLFEDLMYQMVPSGSSVDVGLSAKGLGSRPSDVRTLFNKEGPFEPGSAMTDMAITGKGFFRVSDDENNLFYTRAGNFRFDAEGTLRDPNGLAVTGIPFEDGVKGNNLEEININFNDEEFATDPPKATESLTALMNLNVTSDTVADPANPYFSMLAAWDGTQSPSLSKTDYTQPLRVYDSEGNPHDLTVHFDLAPSPTGSGKTLEYIVTMPPGEDAREGISGTAGAGLLMSGTLSFSPNGELINMSAFTPGGGNPKDLSNWTPATLTEDGSPQLSLNFAGQDPQAVSLNFGISGSGWEGDVANAAQLGTSHKSLPRMADETYASDRTSSFPVSSALKTYRQDGYPVGDLNDLTVGEDGTITAHYSNGQIRDIYSIPIFNFTSEDGLRRDGNNLYSQTQAAGNVHYGTAGTENYGGIQGNFLEGSNVEMSQEMVNMIIMQRGFQSNSKSITTLDTMIQKAIELKR